MANDVHYISIFVIFFIFLGLVSPLLNEEFNSNLTAEDVEGQDPTLETQSASSSVFVLINLFVLPFWTFGLPAWLNLWILLPIRIIFMFTIARNVWVGGGS